MSRIRLARLALSLALLAVPCGCSTPPPPVYPVAAAPPELAKLRFHVHNASHARSQADHENVTGYTLHVRNAFARALVRAGYVVVTNPDDPYDLLARIDTEHQSTGSATGTLTTSLTLRANGAVIAQLSTVVRIDEHADIDERDVIALVESLARSGELRAFAARPRPKPGAEIAAPP